MDLKEEALQSQRPDYLAVKGVFVLASSLIVPSFWVSDSVAPWGVGGNGLGIRIGQEWHGYMGRVAVNRIKAISAV